MAISYSIFFSTEAGIAYINPEVTDLLKFWTEKVIATDASEKEKPRLGLLVENEPQTICVPRSEKGVELRLGGEKKGLFTNLVVVWMVVDKRTERRTAEEDEGYCLELAAGGEEHSCDRRSCVRIQAIQRKDLAPWFGDIAEKVKSDVQTLAYCYASTTVNLATALGFFSSRGSLESLVML